MEIKKQKMRVHATCEIHMKKKYIIKRLIESWSYCLMWHEVMNEYNKISVNLVLHDKKQMKIQKLIEFDVK